MSKLKVYEGIVCLEIRSANGGQWWYQTPSLAYTPVRIKAIRRLAKGYVGVRPVLVVPVTVGGQEMMVRVNLPRSDVWTLERLGMLPAEFPRPTEAPAYTPWPRYAQQNPELV